MVNPKSIANLRPYTKGHNYSSNAKKGPYLVPILRKFINKKISYEDPSTKQMIEGKVKDAILWRLILNACQGEFPAIKEILERLDGKTVQVVEGDGVKETNIIIIRDGDKTKTVSGQVHIQQEQVSGDVHGLGLRENAVHNLAGNALQRADTE